MSDYDVVIVGTGAGGGTLARHLAPSGKRVLLLERGDWLPREPQNWSAADVFIDNRYISADRWYDDKGKAFQPQVHYFVGGATKLYGAALYRLRQEDFGESGAPGRASPMEPFLAGRYHSLMISNEQVPDELEVAARTKEDGTIMACGTAPTRCTACSFIPSRS